MPERPDARRDILDKGLLTMLLSSDEGHNGPTCRGRAMERLLPHAHISNSSRRRLARWLVGSPIGVVALLMVKSGLLAGASWCYRAWHNEQRRRMVIRSYWRKSFRMSNARWTHQAA